MENDYNGRKEEENEWNFRCKICAGIYPHV